MRDPFEPARSGARREDLRERWRDVPPEKLTPWQRVAVKFGTQRALVKATGLTQSRVSVLLRDPEGLIDGKDQKILAEAAARYGIELSPWDMLPNEAREPYAA